MREIGGAMKQQDYVAASADVESMGSGDAADATFEGICAHLELNRANTLPFCACLSACREPVSYREVEARLSEEPVMRTSTQTPYMLLRILIGADAIEAVPLREEGASDDDRPIDYELKTSDLGVRALEKFAPGVRLAELIGSEPEGYADAYRIVLEACRSAVSMSDIERSLAGHPALQSPQQVFASYFVSKLETVGGIVWDGSWRLTEEGARMAESLSAQA